MMITEGRAATDRPERYLKQLVSHFSNKASTSESTIQFEAGAATLTAVQGALVARIEAADEEKLARVQDVIVRHAERFGVKDELKFGAFNPVTE